MRTRILLLSLLLWCSFATPVRAGTRSLQVVYSAGVRGRMMPVAASQADCTLANIGKNASCWGGVSRRAAYISEARARQPNSTIVLDSGNYYFGTLFASFDRGATIGQWVSASGYDVLGVGLNEFFQGPLEYATFLSRVTPNHPQIVCSNIDASAEPVMPAGVVQPWVVVQIGAESVGVVGCVDDSLVTSSSPGPNIRVNDGGNSTCVLMLSRAIAKLKIAHPTVNIIIATLGVTSSHAAQVRQVAFEVQDVDIVVAEFSPFSAAGSYAMITSNLGYNVAIATIPLVASPSVFVLGGSMATLQATFDADGYLLAANSSLALLDRFHVDDPRFWNTAPAGTYSIPSVQLMLASVNRLNAVVVGQMTVDLVGAADGLAPNASFSCRNTVCSVGMFVTDTMLDWCTDCDISHINAGGLRGDLLAANVQHYPNFTRTDVLRILPFGNTLVTYNIRGSDFYSHVIKFSVSLRSTLGFHQFGNLRIAFNPANGAVIQVQMWDRSRNDWVLFDFTRILKVTTILYAFTGGDKYDIASVASNAFVYGPNDAETVVASLAAHGMRAYPTQAALEACWSAPHTLASLAAHLECRYAITNDIGNAAACPTSLDTSLCQPGVEAYPGRFYNASCDICTGLGACIGSRCSCDRPDSIGPFAGLSMVQGPACDVFRTEYPYQSGLRWGLITLSALTALLACSSSWFFYRYRGTRIVRRSSPVFLQICCFGSLIGAATAIAITLPTSNLSCVLADWGGHIGFMLIFGALYIKTMRLYRIFSNTHSKQLGLSDAQMVVRLGVLVGAEIILRLVETVVSPLQETKVAFGDSNSSLSTCPGTVVADVSSFYFFSQCDSSRYTLFDGLKWGTKICLTLWGVALAISVRHIDKNYNESKALGMVIYNMAVFAGLTKVAVIFLGTFGPQASPGLTVVCINYILICTLIGITVPKWLHIRGGGEEEDTFRPMAFSNKLSQNAIPASTKANGSESDSGGASSPKPSASPVVSSATVMQHCAQYLNSLSNVPSEKRLAQLKSALPQARQFLSTLQSLYDSSTAEQQQQHPKQAEAQPSRLRFLHVAAPGPVEAQPAAIPADAQPEYVRRLAQPRVVTTAVESPSISPSAADSRSPALASPSGRTQLPAATPTSREIQLVEMRPVNSVLPASDQTEEDPIDEGVVFEFYDD